MKIIWQKYETEYNHFHDLSEIILNFQKYVINPVKIIYTNFIFRFIYLSIYFSHSFVEINYHANFHYNSKITMMIIIMKYIKCKVSL